MPEREQSAYRLAKLMKRARRQMANAIRERLEPLGTCLGAVQIIRRVAAEGQLNQLELARQIDLEPGALCRLVVELESKGLVVRRRDAADNRRVLVAATPAGEALLGLAQPHVLAGVEEMASRLSRSEQAELCRLLEKLADQDDRPAEGSEPAPPVSRAAASSPRKRRVAVAAKL